MTRSASRGTSSKERTSVASRRPAVVAVGTAAHRPWSSWAASLGFARPTYVDQNPAGGEPLVTADPVHGTLVYTSHEGTTHLYQPGLATSSVLPFLVGYRDLVNMWTSKDNGKTWQI